MDCRSLIEKTEIENMLFSLCCLSSMLKFFAWFLCCWYFGYMVLNSCSSNTWVFFTVTQLLTALPCTYMYYMYLRSHGADLRIGLPRKPLCNSNTADSNLNATSSQPLESYSVCFKWMASEEKEVAKWTGLCFDGL